MTFSGVWGATMTLARGHERRHALSPVRSIRSNWRISPRFSHTKRFLVIGCATKEDQITPAEAAFEEKDQRRLENWRVSFRRSTGEALLSAEALVSLRAANRLCARIVVATFLRAGCKTAYASCKVEMTRPMTGL